MSADLVPITPAALEQADPAMAAEMVTAALVECRGWLTKAPSRTLSSWFSDRVPYAWPRFFCLVASSTVAAPCLELRDRRRVGALHRSSPQRRQDGQRPDQPRAFITTPARRTAPSITRMTRRTQCTELAGGADAVDVNASIATDTVSRAGPPHDCHR